VWQNVGHNLIHGKAGFSKIQLLQVMALHEECFKNDWLDPVPAIQVAGLEKRWIHVVCQKAAKRYS